MANRVTFVGDLPAGITWKKSGRSGPNGACAEFARISPDEIAMRNSRDPEGPALVYTQAEINALIGGAKDGDFDEFTS